MLKRNLRLLLACSCVFLASCAGAPPDVPVCVEINLSRGYCTKIMSGKSFDVDDDQKFSGQTWWEMRATMIQMPATTWRELKKWIIKSCKNNSQCDSKLANWERTVNTIDKSVSDRSASE